ncbi:MAG: ATP-grasp domain-containing protein [Spirochaetaceae bacterium]|jgi:D-alanine--D-alanine ligase|nr:ATP-grasp domain-containing protein [Spirochaetaceae bacterium]
MKITIIYGGESSERENSKNSAMFVGSALEKKGHKVNMLFYDANFVKKLLKLKQDLVFICVQGKGHGDGTLQAILDFLGIKYTGSHTMAAAIINDKIVCKELFKNAGIRTPDWQTLNLEDYNAERFDFSRPGYPFVAKAPTQGASVGIELINSAEDIKKIAGVFEYDDPILIEKFTPGHFASVGILRRNGKLITFPPMGIAADRPEHKTEIMLTPAQGRSYPWTNFDFSTALVDELNSLALRSFAVTRAEGYARVDMMVSLDDGLPYVLEINAVPGLRSDESSLLPLGASLYGIKYDDLVETIAMNALSCQNV